MIEKIIEVLGSVSFWISVLGAVILILGQQGVISMEIATIIAGWCGVGIGHRLIYKATISK